MKENDPYLVYVLKWIWLLLMCFVVLVITPFCAILILPFVRKLDENNFREVTGKRFEKHFTVFAWRPVIIETENAGWSYIAWLRPICKVTYLSHDDLCVYYKEL